MGRRRRLPALSIGTKWALRYTLVTLTAVGALFAYIYDRAEDRILGDVETVADIAARAAASAVRRHGADLRALSQAFEREVAASDPDLQMGLQYFGRDGRLRLVYGPAPLQRLGLHSRVRDGRPRHFFDANLGKKYPYYVVAQRVEEGYIQAAVYGRRSLRAAKNIRDAFLLALPLGLVLIAGLGWGLARVSLRPIARITASARRIGGANLEERVPTTGTGDDLDQLAVTLNEMIGRIRESMARMRRFSADAAHELRTPLAAVRNQIEVTLEKERQPAEYEQVLRQMLEEIAMLAGGVDGMLRLAESEAGLDPRAVEPVELRAVLRTVVEFFEPLADDRGVALGLAEGGPALVSGDPTWLQRLFANLVDNALKFTPAGGRVEVALELDAERQSASVAVRDTGVGIEPAERERVFERLHKVGPARSGAGFGLGLALAREIARAHGGTIEVESEVGRGSTFLVRLPLARPAAD